MPIPKENKQINRSFMRDEVYNTLLNWITEGVLRPGEKLLDKDLAETLGVSRTPVREALRRLEDKDLVEAAASRWTRVSKISIEEAEQIYPIIWVLEELAVSMALSSLTDQDFEEMAAANADLKAAIDAKDPIRASQADAQFHDVLIRRSGNPHLINIIQDLKIKRHRLEVHYFEGSATASDSVVEHNQILEALKARRLDTALALIKSNWEASLERVRAQMQAENEDGEQ